MLNDGIGPVKLLTDMSKETNWVRFPIEFGIDPLKSQIERSILDNIARLPIESGSAPENFVPLSSSDRREPFGRNSGKEPWSSSLYDKSIVCSVRIWETFSGNVPFNPQERRPKEVKFAKFAKKYGTGALKRLKSRRIIERDWSFCKEIKWIFFQVFRGWTLDKMFNFYTPSINCKSCTWNK